MNGRVVTIETTSRYHHTDAGHGSWGPGTLFSKVHLSGFHFDGCSEGLWNGGGGRRAATVVTRAGKRIASVWITLGLARMRLALPIALVALALGPAASTGHASYLVDRNAKAVKLQVDAGGHALVS